MSAGGGEKEHYERGDGRGRGHEPEDELEDVPGDGPESGRERACGTGADCSGLGGGRSHCCGGAGGAAGTWGVAVGYGEPVLAAVLADGAGEVAGAAGACVQHP